MTINATAMILLAIYVAVGRKQGVPEAALSGTIQNDILKEYAARGTYRFPPAPSLRLITDVFEHAADSLPQFNTVSVSGYHIREAGATAPAGARVHDRERARVRRAPRRSAASTSTASRPACRSSSTRRATSSRRSRSSARRGGCGRPCSAERFAPKDPKSLMLRFHTQTAGSTLTADQFENNAVRVTLQALSAVLGGTQSLHTNARDEALALPSEGAALLALRTQQIIAEESGVTNVIDPLGGAPFVEALTDQVEAEARKILAEVDRLGGAAAAIEAGYYQREIHRSALRAQRDFEAGPPDRGRRQQAPRRGEARPRRSFRVVRRRRERRRSSACGRVRARRPAGPGRRGARGARARGRARPSNLFPRVLACVEADVTIGEICATLERPFGKYREVPVF